MVTSYFLAFRWLTWLWVAIVTFDDIGHFLSQAWNMFALSRRFMKGTVDKYFLSVFHIRIGKQVKSLGSTDWAARSKIYRRTANAMAGVGCGISRAVDRYLEQEPGQTRGERP